MKKATLTIFNCFIIVAAFAQASTTLSNLVSPTAINQSLLPNSINSGLSLGDSLHRWKNIQISGSGIIYKSGLYFISSPGGGLGVGTSTLVNNQSTSQGTGDANVAIGNYSLTSNTFGDYNTACGSSALRSNTTGGNNTAIGYFALGDNDIGGGNTAVGWQAMSLNVSGDGNTAVGSNVLQFNTSGVQNCAFGSNTLNQSNSCSYNSAFGYESCFYNSTGNYNSALGRRTLYYNTSGERNTAVGYQSLHYNTTGDYNTGSGMYSLYRNTTASYNTAVGYNSGDSYANSSYNTFIGYDADASAASFTNSTAIGRGARVTASNRVRLGNSSVTQIGGYVNWTNVSDGRYKRNIQENVIGLEFINKLRPVTYNLNVHGINEKTHVTENADDKESLEAKEKIVYTGFIAQEVEKAAQQIGYDFSGVDIPKNESDLYGLRYAEFTVPLVKAVQELSKQNEELKNEIQSLKKKYDQLAQKISLTSNNNYSNGFLGQNIPNPFNKNTTIPFVLPNKFTSALIKLINSQTGQTITEYQLTQNQTSQEVNLNLPNGIYSYSLIIDDATVDTKQMVNLK